MYKYELDLDECKMLLESVQLVNDILNCNDRIIGLDYGKQSIGIALSDSTRSIANPLLIFRKDSGKDLIDLLFKLIADNNIKLIVIGMPISLNGSSNIMCKAVKDFQVALSRNLAKYTLNEMNLGNKNYSDKFLRFVIDMPIIFWDERFSSLASQKCLKEMQVMKSKRSDHIDKIAASIILQSFLDYINYDH